MNKIILLGIFVALCIFATAGMALNNPTTIGSTPPPTKSLTLINGTDGEINFSIWNDFLSLIEGTGIDFDFDDNTNQLTINAGLGAASLHDLTNVTSDFCTTGQTIKAINNEWVCANDDSLGDNLGDHLATLPLNLDENYLIMKRNTTTVPVPSSNTLNIFVESTAGRPIIKATGESGITYELSGDTISVCRNISGSGMVRGDLVYVNGGNLQRVIVSLARADSESTLPVFGVLLEDIADNSNGLCLNSGLLKNYDTTGTPFGETWNEGDLLWIDETNAGEFTNSKPTLPSNYPQRVGSVINKHATNGVIYFYPVTIRGNFEGTNNNDFSIGSGLAGTKSLTYNNGFMYSLAANPSANRLAVLPDKDGTVAFTDDIVSSALNDLTDVTITTPAYNHILQYRAGQWINKLFTANSITCSGDDKFSAYNNNTGVFTCSTDQTGGGAVDIIQEGNSNVEVIDSGTGQVDIDIDGTNEFRFTTNLFNMFAASFNNAIFDVAGTGNRLTSTSIALGDILKSDGTDFKRLARGSANQVLKVNSGGTDIEWGTDDTGGGRTVLASTVTSTSTSAYTAIFTIPLTASKYQSIDFDLIADSDTSGDALQFRTSLSAAGAIGNCNYATPTSATATTFDLIAVGAAADTAETAILNTNPFPVRVYCTVLEDASASNLILEFQNEVAGTVHVRQGSSYLHTVAP